MKSVWVHRVRRGLVSSSVLLVALLVATPMAAPVSAQSPAAAKEPAKAEKKVSGRLPAYYGQVVTKDQREKIYGIQAKFGEQLVKLREQIAMLEKQLQDEVQGVLTPEQRDEIAKKVADAKAKRSKATATESGSAEGAGGSSRN